MTTQADEVFRKVLEHYNELLSLIKTEDDKDTFQDTVLWMATHSHAGGHFVGRFRTRFRYLKIENHSRLIPLTREVADPSQPYEEKTSNEREDVVLQELHHAILTEEKEAIAGGRRPKKKSQAKGLLDEEVEGDEARIH